MNLICVAPERSAECWPLAERFIRSALDRVGLMSVADIDPGSLLWLAVDDTRVWGAGLTVKNGDVLEIVAWGSDDQSRCAPLLNELEAYARAEGCTRSRLIGRKGWRKLDGYQEKAVIMEKAL